MPAMIQDDTFVGISVTGVCFGHFCIWVCYIVLEEVSRLEDTPASSQSESNVNTPAAMFTQS